MADRAENNKVPAPNAPNSDQEPQRSRVPDDRPAPPHRDEMNRKTAPGRDSAAPSSPSPVANRITATESPTKKACNGLLQQNRHKADLPRWSANCPISGGEFNRSVQHQLQSIGRGFEGQGLSRALIEPQSNGIEVGLGEVREIGSSREVLSQQAVGVLVAATLPWTARITEVNLHVGGNREAFVARHLLALVPRQGAS